MLITINNGRQYASTYILSIFDLAWAIQLAVVREAFLMSARGQHIWRAPENNHYKTLYPTDFMYIASNYTSEAMPKYVNKIADKKYHFLGLILGLNKKNHNPILFIYWRVLR